MLNFMLNLDIHKNEFLLCLVYVKFKTTPSQLLKLQLL